LIVVNLLGGPGTGKSTTAAGVFSKLKWRGVNAELATEFAKDKVWEGSLAVLEDQVYILGKEYHKLHRLDGKVDVFVTDSPLFLSLMYGEHLGDNFAALAIELFLRYDNLTYFLQREKPYNPAGRVQTEGRARELDERILKLLDSYDVPFRSLPARPSSEVSIVTDIVTMLNT
jgi:hypothetical protein